MKILYLIDFSYKNGLGMGVVCGVMGLLTKLRLTQAGPKGRQESLSEVADT